MSLCVITTLEIDMKRYFFILALGLGAALPVAAFADCRVECPPGLNRYGSCTRTCWDSTPSTPSSQGTPDSGGVSRFGAIATTRSGTFGWASGQGSLAVAQRLALQNCRARAESGATCEISVWTNNRCAAVAKAGDGSWGTTWAWSSGQAGQSARQSCEQAGGRGCQVVHTQCD